MESDRTTAIDTRAPMPHQQATAAVSLRQPAVAGLHEAGPSELMDLGYSTCMSTGLRRRVRHRLSVRAWRRPARRSRARSSTRSRSVGWPRPRMPRARRRTSAGWWLLKAVKPGVRVRDRLPRAASVQLKLRAPALGGRAPHDAAEAVGQDKRIAFVTERRPLDRSHFRLLFFPCSSRSANEWKI